MDFYASFTQRKQAIEHSIAASPGSQQNLQEISLLLQDVRNNRGKLNTHDLDSYEKELAALSELCRQKPKKFAFSSKISAKAKTSSSAIKSNVEESEARRAFVVVGPTNNLDHCIVFSELPIKTQHLANISNSIIYLPHVEGPIYLTNIQSSVIVAQCHQFRMHRSHNCDIFLGTKHPIIEECTNIRFGTSVLGDKWERIDDFDWIRDTPSANWEELPGPAPDFKWIKTEAGRNNWLQKAHEAKN